MRLRVRALLLVLAIVVASCASSAGGDDPVFVEVTHEQVDCWDEAGASDVCLEVLGSVDGQSEGSGRCVLYPTVTGRNLPAVAENDDLAMVPGEMIVWRVAVPEPTNPDFQGWNPVCSPMAEG